MISIHEYTTQEEHFAIICAVDWLNVEYTDDEGTVVVNTDYHDEVRFIRESLERSSMVEI